MKLLIIGCGSIGTRHAKNAKAKGHELLLFDVDASRANSLASELDGSVIMTIEEGISKKPDAALICTPPNLHTGQALACIDARIPVFIEKPLAHSLENVDRLVKAAKEKDVLTMVACNLRFTEGLQKVKSLVPGLGKLMWARIEFGYDLKKWRPNQDYRKNYAAFREQGGGIVLDAIHEIDYACWLFGKPLETTSEVVRSGLLEIETEDCADFTINFERCSIVKMHLDYIQPKYQRYCTIVGKNGTVHWDFMTGAVHSNIDGKEDMISTNTDLNSMYVTELDYFIDRVSKGTQPMNPVSEAAETLRLALELREKGEQQ